jgi:DNA-binding NarL/FixJ family response regulator
VDLTLNCSHGGLELIKTLHAMYPDLPILVISMHEESLYAERVLRAGARGYIMKEEASVKVIRAMKEFLAGRLFISDEVRARTESADARGLMGTLSDRELEVFELIGKGNGMAEIARILSISVKTVEVHREHIKLKLGIRTASELRKLTISWDREKEALKKT